MPDMDLLAIGAAVLLLSFVLRRGARDSEKIGPADLARIRQISDEVHRREIVPFEAD